MAGSPSQNPRPRRAARVREIPGIRGSRRRANDTPRARAHPRRADIPSPRRAFLRATRTLATGLSLLGFVDAILRRFLHPRAAGILYRRSTGLYFFSR